MSGLIFGEEFDTHVEKARQNANTGRTTRSMARRNDGQTNLTNDESPNRDDSESEREFNGKNNESPEL